MPDLILREWSTYGPSSKPELRNLFLRDAKARCQAKELTESRRISILELRDGLQVTTGAWVGHLSLGDLNLSIQPKLTGMPLLRLLRYAYGLRELRLFEMLPQGTEARAFQDLLIQQLALEAEELLARGLRRHYARRCALLSTPRGRIDFGSLARQPALAQAALPCTHHPRSDDVPVNRALLSGLGDASRLTSSLSLRNELRRLAAYLAESVTTVRLTRDVLRQARLHEDRLTSSYRPALAIVELLLAGQGTALDDTRSSVSVPGFLFDMNRFFQALLSRFLREGLPGCELRDESRLTGMLSYDPRRNPRQRQAPAARPDFIVRTDKHRVTILDAKYRDLWEKALPREMLYQLVIYASTAEADGHATILYPTLDARATEACVEVRSPSGLGRLGAVIVRPVKIQELDDVISRPQGSKRVRDCAAYAQWLAFGMSGDTKAPSRQ